MPAGTQRRRVEVVEAGTSKSQTQFTSLLSNELLARIERMRLNPNRRLTNRSRGEHLAGKGGSSTDFADYRDYVEGDDTRYVDWNIFARLRRPYLKQFQHEEELHVVLLIDASSSMLHEGKLERACQLAGAFGVMGLLNVERVSAYVCSSQETRPAIMPPCSGRISMKRLFDFLESVEGGGDLAVEEAVQKVLRLHRGRGIVCILSDFLTFGDCQRSFNMLFSAGLEIFAAQILSPSEIDPELTGDIRLVDSETQHTLDISSAGNLIGLYHEHRLGLAEYLGKLCRQRNGRFLSISSADLLENVLLDQMARHGWVLR